MNSNQQIRKMFQSELKTNEQALIELLCGINISLTQIPQLNLFDIVITEKLVFFRVGERLAIVAKHKCPLFFNYVLERIKNGYHENEPLFIGSNGKRISLEDIWILIQKFLDIVSSSVTYNSNESEEFCSTVTLNSKSLVAFNTSEFQ